VLADAAFRFCIAFVVALVYRVLVLGVSCIKPNLYIDWKPPKILFFGIISVGLQPRTHHRDDRKKDGNSGVAE
jgi:hypothetical protein